MKLVEALQAIFLLPQTRKHLIEVQKILGDISYLELIEKPHKLERSKYSINVIVKSYFWAGRTIKDCKCLPRSIALYQKLQASGFEVEHKFGVNTENKKFAAHAWVEYKQQPLNEAKDLASKFNALKSRNQY